MKIPVWGLACSLLAVACWGQEITIQEGEVGFCGVDGEVLDRVEGFTGSGYADTDIGLDYSASWSVSAPAAAQYALVWRYGNGGGDGTDRPARVVLNGTVAREQFSFPHTGDWTNWTESDTLRLALAAGYNSIRLEARSSSGLGNIDYVKVDGEAIAAVECVPTYVLSAAASDPIGGTVSLEPVQHYYDAGTQVTLRAQARPGYFFQSWSGGATSSDEVYTFSIAHNVDATAIFLPEGTRADPNLTGYASVQDDRGTPYLLIGGALGDTVKARTLGELQALLGDDVPRVVTFSGQLTGAAEIDIGSHKTLLGIGAQAHLRGIGLQINRARNVIVRNLQISHVTPQDAIEINNGSRHIWIDRCELYSDREHGKDFYDGLLDIKNESSFITISWSSFHDHFKTSLISSGDHAVADTVIRVTYHHNRFYNCGSRLPSVHFAKVHVFNNHYQNCSTAINSRMGACVRVENNSFTEVGRAVMMEFSEEPGAVQLLGNRFGASQYASEPTCELDVLYAYEAFLDPADALPDVLARGPATVVAETAVLPAADLSNYPNPFNPVTNIRFALSKTERVMLEVFDVGGRKVATLLDGRLPAGFHRVLWDAGERGAGVYFYKITTEHHTAARKMVLIK